MMMIEVTVLKTARKKSTRKIAHIENSHKKWFYESHKEAIITKDSSTKTKFRSFLIIFWFVIMEYTE